jgi:hypothetical protein
MIASLVVRATKDYLHGHMELNGDSGADEKPVNYGLRLLRCARNNKNWIPASFDKLRTGAWE